MAATPEYQPTPAPRAPLQPTLAPPATPKASGHKRKEAQEEEEEEYSSENVSTGPSIEQLKKAKKKPPPSPVTRKKGLSAEEKEKRSEERKQKQQAKAKAKAAEKAAAKQAALQASADAKQAAIARQAALEEERRQAAEKEEAEIIEAAIARGNSPGIIEALKPAAAQKQPAKPAGIANNALAAVLKPAPPRASDGVSYDVPDALKPKPMAGLLSLGAERAGVVFSAARTLMRNNARHVKRPVFLAELQKLDNVDFSDIDGQNLAGIAAALYTNHGNHIKRARKDLFRTFALEQVQDSAWLTESRCGTLAARFLLIDTEYDVTDAEKHFVRNALMDFLSPAEHENVQRAISGPR